MARLRQGTRLSRRIAAAALIGASLAGLTGCQSGGETTGQCEVMYRFENVRRQGGQDEWTDIARILNKHAAEPIPPPTVSGFKSLGRGDIRTCEVPVVLANMGQMAAIEGELQSLGDKNKAAQRLEFNLERATMLYRSNYVSAGLDITLRGVTNPYFTVVVFMTPDGGGTTTRSDRSGAWRVAVSAVPESRFIYGYSQDPARRIRTKFFRIDVSSMRQETVSKADFMAAVNLDPDVGAPKVASQPPARAQSNSGRHTSAATNDGDWARDSESDARWEREMERQRDW